MDGYNIIGAWPELSQIKGYDFEEARDQLIHMLADYQAYSGIQVYLVFDAYHGSWTWEEVCAEQAGSVYTKEKETADERIERWLAN